MTPTAAHREHVQDAASMYKLQESEALSDELASSKQKLLLVGAQVVLSGNAVTLKENVRAFLSCMRDHGLVFFEETMAHDREFFKSLPGMAASFDRYSAVTSNNAVDLLPVFSPPHGDRTPVLLLTTCNNELYSYDPSENLRNNWNAAVFGASGSGKSVFMNMLITCGMLGGRAKGRLMVVDFAGETQSSYLMVSKLFGGVFIPVLSDRGVSINPFPPASIALAPDGSVRARTMNFLSLLTDILVRNEGADKDSELYRVLIQRAVAEVYRGLEGHAAPLYSDFLEVLRRNLSDPERAFEHPRLNVLVELLAAFLDGPNARLFNRPTSITTTSPFVIFDLFGVETLPANVREAVTFMVCEKVRDLA